MQSQTDSTASTSSEQMAVVDEAVRVAHELWGTNSHLPGWKNRSLTIAWNLLSVVPVPFLTIPAAAAQTGMTIKEVVQAKRRWSASFLRVRQLRECIEQRATRRSR